MSKTIGCFGCVSVRLVNHSAKYLTFVALVAAFACFLSSSTLANSSDWIIKRVSGKVYLVAPGVQAFLAKPGMRIESGYTVATKARSKALIMRGEESIFVGPDTKLEVARFVWTGWGVL